MPYLREYTRDLLDEGAEPISPGELNYVITKHVLAYIDKVGPRYETFNAAVGALECAKQELYRRMIAPYEDEKIVQNGDMYPS